jgi:SulP family sulfate permease
LNYASGAKTPLSAIFAAIILMLIVLLIAPLMGYLPIAAMAGVILVVAYNLIDFHHIRETLSFSIEESAVLITTFLATLFLELEFAIYLGVLLSLVLFLGKTSTPSIPTLSLDETQASGKKKLIDINEKPLKQCPQLKIIRIDMSIYFGSVNHIQKRIATISENERINHILIVASGINFIDLAGTKALIAENNRLVKNGGNLYFVGLKPSVYEFAAKSHFIQQVGMSHFFDTKKQAIKHIYKELDREICATCPALIFDECAL